MAMQLRLLVLSRHKRVTKEKKPGHDGQPRAVTETVLGPRPAFACRHLSQAMGEKRRMGRWRGHDKTRAVVNKKWAMAQYISGLTSDSWMLLF